MLQLEKVEERKMTKRLSLTANGFVRRQDLDFTDDGTRFTAYDYKGLPITYCKYQGIYYLSIRVDYLNNVFTYDDWRATEEYKLEDEFNGVSEIDINKLVENCEAILVKMAELNRAVKKETIDILPILGQLEEEIAYGEKVLDEFKHNFKWWAVNEWKLTSIRRYMDSLVSNINRCRDLAELLAANKLETKNVRYYAQYLAKYGHIVIGEDNFYCKELKAALEEN